MPDDDGLPLRLNEVGRALTLASLPVGRIRYRIGPADVFASENPVLALFEAGVEDDAVPYPWKVGNGVDAYDVLPYQGHELPSIAFLRLAFAGVDAVDDALAGIATAYDVAVAQGFVGSIDDFLFDLQGDQGLQGQQGAVGRTAGALPWTYEAGFDNEPGQGDGIVRFDNPLDISNIGNVYISTTTADAVDAEAWLTRIGASGGRGEFHVVNEDDPSQFVIMEVSGIPDDVGPIWHFEVGTVAFGNPFDADALLDIAFAPDGPQGIAGNEGSSGNDGVPPGILMQLDLSTHADADPGANFIRTNHATFGSITKLYVDDLDQVGNNIAAWFAAMGTVANPVKGQLYISSADFGSLGFYVFEVTGVTDAAGYTKLDVTPLVNGNVVDGTSVSLIFTRAGDAG